MAHRLQNVARMSIRSVALLFFGLLAFPAKRARACDPIDSSPVFALGPASDDLTPPTTPSILDASLHQDATPSPGACGDQGVFSLTVSPAVADRSAPEELGYLLEVVDGVPPFTMPGGLRPFGGQPADRPLTLYVTFGHTNWGGTFRLAVRAVDPAGNPSAPSLPFAVTGQPVGCSAVGDATSPSALGGLLLATIAAAVARREGRRISRRTSGAAACARSSVSSP